MDVHISIDDRRDLAGQVYRQIRAAVLDGRLRPGQPVPSTRELATRLALSRTTVSVAYDRLVDEGFLTGRAGVGTYINDVAAGGDAGPTGHDDAVPLRPRAVWQAQPEPADLSAVEPQFDFRAGMPDVRRFPFGTWRALVARHLTPAGVRQGRYADPAGHHGLRTAVARHLGVSRAVRASADDVLITSGTQQALDLVGRVLVGPGEVVAMEDPGYPPARLVFESMGARMAAVPVDAEGLVVDALPPDARLVYVSPSHQFPLGTRMSLTRRLGLLAWAHRTGAVIVEDDYDCEFRYTGRPLEPLHNLDRTGRVVYVSSFSKTLLPTLRLGYCVAPRSLFGALRKAKYVLDWHTALPMQAALAEFVEQGLLARHIRRMRAIYQARRDLINTCLDRDLADRLEVVSSLAGLHLAARLRSGDAVEERAVVARARAVGVEVKGLSDFAWWHPGPAGFVLGYGLIPRERIERGLSLLGHCLGL